MRWLRIFHLAVCLRPGASYWFNPNIHQLGHTGVRGRLHAELSSFAITLIDWLSYSGENVRIKVSEDTSTVDFGCGVGLSTPPGAVGVDTSRAMVNVAQRDSSKTFFVGNAETFGENEGFDAATAVFLMHEVPRGAWHRILDNMRRVSRHKIVIVDIHASKKPSDWMLRGEPYLSEYLSLFDATIRTWADGVGDEVVYDEPVPKRVSRWQIVRSESMPTRKNKKDVQ